MKKASPSKGVIAKDFPYLDIARAYEAAGAEAISCLTEPKWFLGSDQIFREIRQAVATPDAPQGLYGGPLPKLYQARLMGADCVFAAPCWTPAPWRTTWPSAMTWACPPWWRPTMKREVASAVSAGARIIGGNNRNLGDFSVNLDNAAPAAGPRPPGVLYVAESGVHRPADVAAVRAMGADGVLIGEALMRAKDKSAAKPV